jgi:predicted pyridoxine 5'-phosphate oxidase superfamily flavin-nucleotide-binding protein
MGPALAITRRSGDTGWVAGLYHDGARELQDRFDTRRLADRLEQVKVHDTITPDDRGFIERMDMFFLATADADGRPQCSYKGGDPGFVVVVDEHTVAFPNYDGNGMYLSLGNLRVNPHVGLLFIDFCGKPPRRLRLNGDASIESDDPLLARFPGAQCVVRVRVAGVFPNCPRYIHRMQLVERSTFVPHLDRDTPVPAWKRTEWARDVLSRDDPARLDE